MNLENIPRQKIAMDLLDAMDDASQSMFYVIQDGRFVYGNRHGCHITGLEPVKDIYGKPALSYVHPDDKPLLMEMSRRALKGERLQPFEWRLHTVDGSFVWVLGVLTKIEFDGRPAIFGNYIDITRAKQTRSELQRTSKKVEDLTIDLQSVREEERAQIAWELKENLWHSLKTLKEKIDGLSEDSPPVPDTKDLVHHKIDSALNTITRISAHLDPPEAEHRDLGKAIQWYSQEFRDKTGIAVTLSPFRDEPDIGQKQVKAVFRIFQELLKTVGSLGRFKDINIKPGCENENFKIQFFCRVLKSSKATGLERPDSPLKEIGEKIKLQTGSLTTEVSRQKLVLTASFPLIKDREASEINILFGSRQPILIEGVRQILYPFPDLFISGQAETFLELIEKIKQPEFDLLLADSSVLGGQATGRLKEIKDAAPYLPVLIFHTVMDDDDFAVRMFRQGAAGFLSRSSSTDELICAVQKVAAGRKHISNRIAEKLAFEVDLYAPKPFHHQLSDRERQVMFMIAEGKTMKAIAEELCLSYKTIATYRNRVMEKMNMKTDTEIVRYAVLKGLV